MVNISLVNQVASAAFDKANRFLPVSMRYGHFRYYWLALLAGVTGHQMLLSFTLGWLMFDLTGEERDLAFLGIAIAVPALALELVGRCSSRPLRAKVPGGIGPVHLRDGRSHAGYPGVD